MEKLIHSIKNLTIKLNEDELVDRFENLSITKTLTFIDLFCGIGGFHLALNNIKDIQSKCLLACDIDKKCQEAYELNFNIKPDGDIKTLKMVKCFGADIIFGGFPCVSHSFAGKRLGLNDTRGTLIYDLFKVIKEIKPKFCILENVKGIKTSNNGKTFKLIHDISDQIGYNVTTILTNPKEINIPQNRERYVFILINKKINNPNIQSKVLVNYYKLIDKRRIKNKNYTVLENNPQNKNDISLELKMAIDIWNDLIRHLDGKRYSKITPDYFNSSINKNNKPYKNKHIVDMNKIYNDNKLVIDDWFKRNGRNFAMLKQSLKSLEWNTGVDFCSTSDIYGYYIQVRQSGLRVKKNTLFPTLVRSGTIPIIGQYKRYITVNECARLQSFPDYYKFLNNNTAYAQLGNSVNVEIMEIVIRATLIGLNII
jgi:DNA (cytosine-5)-methyltransferase 1